MSVLEIGKILDILRTFAVSIFHACAEGQKKTVRKYTLGNAGSLDELPRGGGTRSISRRVPEWRHVNTDDTDQRDCPDYCAPGSYLTQDYSQIRLDPYSRRDQDAVVLKGNWELGGSRLANTV